MISQNPYPHKYLCVHGHFYQPPRENPWLDAIECQETAFPYHDWNERITRECYGPNTRGRLHGKEGRILRLVNNYEYMSYNFGPTLLMWLEDKHPWIYSQIIAADKAGSLRYNGHGNALAQVYNHIIMPLATPRDRVTQIRWGLADFRRRFGRDAEGMWLAETAVDSQTLKLMASEGIKFTILSPSQAQAVRPLVKKESGDPDRLVPGHDSTSWLDVSGGLIDPSRPYRIILDKEGLLSIDVFFYDGPLSRSVAYEKILSSGADLLSRINYIFKNYKDGPQLVNIATDGESYGHHFKFGEMALTWLFDHLEQDKGIALTNYGMFLEMFPPENEVRIFENSSWSCCHGIERWRSDCGCSVGGNPAWNQAWRKPLRQGLDWLATELSVIFEERAAGLLKDPWLARDEYIKPILERSNGKRKDFLTTHSARPLNHNEEIELFRIMESQRMALYMFTSCGWFFDDISGIEAIQVLMYASRAIDLVRSWSKKDLESELMEYLSKAKSNDRRYGNGGNIYQRHVKTSAIGPSLLAANYALASLVKGVEIESWLSELIRVLWEKDFDFNGIKANLGEVDVLEKMTAIGVKKTYLVIQTDENILTCLVGEVSDLDPGRLAEEIRSGISLSLEEGIGVFHRQVPEVQHFEVTDLIPDARKWVIDGLAGTLFSRTRGSIGAHRGLFHEYINIIQKLSERLHSFLDVPTRLFFIDDLLNTLSMTSGENPVDFNTLLMPVSRTGTTGRKASYEKKAIVIMGKILKEPALQKSAQDFLLRNMDSIAQSNSIIAMQNIINYLDFARFLKTEPDLWECQNLYYDLSIDNEFLNALSPDGHKLFQELGKTLGFLIEG